MFSRSRIWAEKASRLQTKATRGSSGKKLHSGPLIKIRNWKKINLFTWSQTHSRGSSRLVLELNKSARKRRVSWKSDLLIIYCQKDNWKYNHSEGNIGAKTYFVHFLNTSKNTVSSANAQFFITAVLKLFFTFCCLNFNLSKQHICRLLINSFYQLSLAVLFKFVTITSHIILLFSFALLCKLLIMFI